MFIDSFLSMRFVAPNGAKCKVRRIHPPVHRAPLERRIVGGREVYKHLAPLEPEHHWTAALLRHDDVVSFSEKRVCRHARL
jgi:hypothetical protein